MGRISCMRCCCLVQNCLLAETGISLRCPVADVFSSPNYGVSKWTLCVCLQCLWDWSPFETCLWIINHKIIFLGTLNCAIRSKPGVRTVMLCHCWALVGSCSGICLVWCLKDPTPLMRMPLESYFFALEALCYADESGWFKFLYQSARKLHLHCTELSLWGEIGWWCFVFTLLRPSISLF